MQSQRQEDLWPRKEFAGEGVLTAFERSPSRDKAVSCTGLCCAPCVTAARCHPAVPQQLGIPSLNLWAGVAALSPSPH